MTPRASTLPITCYKAIESVEDARTVVTECINGDLKLVPRGPSDLEAAQLTRHDAVFVFEAPGQWLDPPEWLEASEPRFNITAIPNDARVDLRRKSITVVVDSRRYHVVVIYRSQNPTNPDLQPRHDNRYGGPDSQLSWPSQLIRPENPAPSKTYVADLMAAAERGLRDGTDSKESTRE